ncbi:MAG: hypothetical protein KJO55_07115, partial [Gammaproteobacteria bacterium]|nr:hypothetical protein [Gammaproteobacteria bacterium]
MVMALSFMPQVAAAGAFIFAGESNGTDVILHPQGYNGSGGVLTVSVCLDPTTLIPAGATISDIEKSIQNNVDVWNQLQPTVGNALQGNANEIAFNEIDFESVALHEVGHCIGLAHVNAASESGLPDSQKDYTKATDGSDNTFNLNAGVDGVIGTLDDLRGDDVNLHWFRLGSNDPGLLPLPSPVDGTTYDRDQSSLPTGHSFAQNLDRDAAATMGHISTSTVKTEAVMQQGSFFDETQRELTADGVATILLGMSGVDEVAGSSDDYQINLVYAGTTSSCDLVMRFTSMSGLAFCSVNGFFIGPDHLRIGSNRFMEYGIGYNWFFNQNGPCKQSLDLVQNQWKQLSLSCEPSPTANTVADLIGDDLSGIQDTDWAIFERDEVNQSYIQLGAGATMNVGDAYWIKTLLANQSIEIEEEFNAENDVVLEPDANGRFNMVGYPYWYDFDWNDVRVIDSGGTPRTLAEADPAGVCQTSSTPVADGCLMSATAYRWNGGGYSSFNGTSTPGTLTNFDGLWVKAFAPGIKLRFPEIRSTAAAPHGRSIAAQKSAQRNSGNSGWNIQLTASSGELSDPDNYFGRYPGAKAGFDIHDLDEPEPFGSPYLTVVFPRPDWGKFAGDYNVDYRPYPGHRRTEAWE